ncbi:hypothetical protein JVT61DRAFT_12441 [Boletus reticuloceps]|uniref:Uncharacterized protein n=1 Tax=Boletus reticuloceps TaxID=495285 RepID=A0A8I2YE11_9AGAM|nr:hypothetical protein JVT61DRAFT_12441 [Boletus reticuloceps]
MKGTRQAKNAAEVAVESTEIDLAEAEESGDDDDPSPVASRDNDDGKSKACDHLVGSAPKRPPTSPPGGETTRKPKRSRKGTITRAVDEESLLVQATEATQVDNASTCAKEPQSIVEGTSTEAFIRPQHKLRPPPIEVAAIASPATPTADMDTQDVGDGDEILVLLNEPGGQNSPDTEEGQALAALGGTTQSSPSVPAANSDIEDTTPVTRPFHSNPNSSREKPKFGASRGLLAGTHGGVLGRGRDGTGSCARVRQTYNTTSKRTNLHR